MGQQVEIDIEKLLKSVLESALATQQPFFTSMLNQIARLESGDSKHEEAIMNLRDAFNRIQTQEHYEKIKVLQAEVQQLKDAQVARSALVRATEWLPKLVGYFIAAVLAVTIYAKGVK